MDDGEPGTSLGCVIRDLRQALGLSQSQLASALTKETGTPVTREYVSRWEHGKHTPRFWLPYLAAVLQVPLSDLEENRVDRGAFLTDVATGVIAPAVAADMLAHGFRSALRGRPNADTWDARVGDYGGKYMTAGAAEIQAKVAADLLVAQQSLDTPRMWDVAARLMVLYAKTFPGSDGAKAVRWYTMAAEAADRSARLETRVWVRGRAAIALGYEGAALPTARMFAGQAIALDDRPSLGRLNALMGLAHAAVCEGDDETAREMLAAGRRVFDAAASPDDAVSDYAVPWWRMQVFSSLLAARLGDEQVAIAAQDAAAKALPPTLPRFATHLELHRALMLARSGDHAGGVAYGRAALAALPPARHSLTLRLLMQEVENAAR